MMVGLGGRDAGDLEKLAAARMVDYVQSVIVSVKPEQYAADVSEEDWTKLKRMSRHCSGVSRSTIRCV